jgi:predicted nuclease of predicted toxin-antitoxin system
MEDGFLRMPVPRTFLKQKILLYFDENFPDAVVSHFANSSNWQKKIKVTNAAECGTLGQEDKFHYSFCQKKRFTLVTLDRDFENDQLYPFTSGMMPGIIIIRANSSETARIIDIFSRVLAFLTWIPFPKSFLLETKIIAGRDSVLMRARNANTKEIRSLYIIPGVTLENNVRHYFGF